MRQKIVRWLLLIGVLGILIGAPAAQTALAGECGVAGGTCG